MVGDWSAAPRSHKQPRSSRLVDLDERGDPMSFTRYGSLEGRTVIITGGASGIGASFVRAFVENGAKVAFLDQQRETGATLADSLGEGAARPLFLPCDLADIAALRAALGEISRGIRPRCRAGQQRCQRPALRVRPDHAGAIRPHDCGQFPPCVFRGTSNRAADARAGLRLDRQYVLGVVDARYPAARSLCLGQGGDRRLHQYARPGAGAAPHPGQRDRARHRAHRAPAPAVVSDRSAGRGGTRGAMPARPDCAGGYREISRCSSPPTTAD